MKILITGASGFIGSKVATYLRDKGHEIYSLSRNLSRSRSEPTTIHWDPNSRKIESERLEGMDVVIHLAGENVADRRWTSSLKARLRDSRIIGTKLLVETISNLKIKPKVFLSSSATGFYGSRPDETLTEESPRGTGFLADLAVSWEQESLKAESFGIRTVIIRTGLVLDRSGGALGKVLLPFKLGLGGPLGDGSQIWSWIEMSDLVRGIEHLIMNQSSRGIYNLVAPRPVTNLEFTRTLGSILNRPTLIPAPAFALRLAIGEMADELLLASARVEPKRLLANGFVFNYPELMPALRKAISS